MNFSKIPPTFLFLLAFLIRLALILIYHFDGLYGQDAYAYYQQSVSIAENLPRGITPPTNFFWPNGYPLVVAFVMWGVGKIPFSGQLVSLFTGAALAPLHYAVCRNLWPENRIGYRVGLLAGLIVATAGQMILSSVLVMADIAALFWAVLGTWLLVGAWDKSNDNGYHPQRMALSGGVLGMAIVTRWIYALLLIPFGSYGLYRWRQRKTPIWHFAMPTAFGLAVILPQISLSLNRPGSLLHSWLVGWRPWNALSREFTHVDGYFRYAIPVGVYYLQPAGHPNYLFPTFGLAALWGLISVWRVRDWTVLILLGGWLGAMYGFLAGIPYENFRFGMSMYPPLVVLASYGTVNLLDRVQGSGLKNLAHGVIAFSIVGMLLWGARASYQFINFHQEQKNLAQRIANEIPSGATLLAFDLTLTLQHYTDLEVVEFFTQDFSMLSDRLAMDQPLYLLINLEQVRTQWVGKPPDVNYRWLKDHATIEEEDMFGSFTLFRLTEENP